LKVADSRDKMARTKGIIETLKMMMTLKRYFFRVLILLSWMLIAGCKNTSPATQTIPASATQTATPTRQPTTTPVPASPTPIEVPLTQKPTPTLLLQNLDLSTQYIISATLDYGWRFLSVSQEITYPNTSTEAITDLTLVVQPNWRSGAFKLMEFAIDGQPVENYTLEIIRLNTPLQQPLPPGEFLDITLSYEITIPPILTSEDFGPNPFGYTIRQMNLTDWYPFVPPYITGQGWLVHNPWFYGEHLVYPAANFDVTIELVNAPEGTVIAASASDQGAGDLHHYQIKQARNFVWSVSPEYQLRRERVGDTLVLGYSYLSDDYPALGAFRATVEALKLFNKLFGPYPYDSLSVIEADFNHGMEYSGLFYLSKAFYNQYNGNPGNYLVTIAAHETAHQWWYGLVGNDQALEPWLDESFCTYSEKLFYENVYPDDLKWWWEVRVNYYNPSGWIDKTIYDTPGYLPYRDAVYLNGAKFFHELRKLIGDDAFFAFLQDYVIQSTDKLATTADFFKILAAHTDVDWKPLVAEYFQNLD